jgi:hypothetical protein
MTYRVIASLRGENVNAALADAAPGMGRVVQTKRWFEDLKQYLPSSSAFRTGLVEHPNVMSDIGSSATSATIKCEYTGTSNTRSVQV